MEQIFEHLDDKHLIFDVAPEDVLVGVGAGWAQRKYIVIQFIYDGETSEYGLTAELALKLMRELDEFVHYS